MLDRKFTAAAVGAGWGAEIGGCRRSAVSVARRPGGQRARRDACTLFRSPRSRNAGAGGHRRSPTDELICLMVAQMLLGIPSERRFLPIDGRRLRHPLPRLPAQTTYNERCRGLAPKLVIFWRAIACELPGFRDSLHLLDTTPLARARTPSTAPNSRPTAASAIPPPIRASSGECDSSSSRARMERSSTSTSSRPTPRSEKRVSPCSSQPLRGKALVAEHELAGREFEQAVGKLHALVVRPSRADEPARPEPAMSWIRQRIESIVQTLKGPCYASNGTW